jgi:hypothetical protein
MQKGMLLFDTAQYDGILKKLDAFNSSLTMEVSTMSIKLSFVELLGTELI